MKQIWTLGDRACLSFIHHPLVDLSLKILRKHPARPSGPSMLQTLQNWPKTSAAQTSGGRRPEAAGEAPPGSHMDHGEASGNKSRGRYRVEVANAYARDGLRWKNGSADGSVVLCPPPPHPLGAQDGSVETVLDPSCSVLPIPPRSLCPFFTTFSSNTRNVTDWHLGTATHTYHPTLITLGTPPLALPLLFWNVPLPPQATPLQKNRNCPCRPHPLNGTGTPPTWFQKGQPPAWRCPGS
ncbi:uncharacterized protein LOC111941280 [Cyanistes caeruleus]|uniref:uncharacterized protein LOC111941280 n=1 Tax=Cyanistes caeruleus TaxID=156563 RepID=UPI000CDAF14E|nr:uncharacterized protein LOC111941280 [Cyanistes caeruleus]